MTKHTVDVVISHGFIVDDVNLVDFAINDHNAVFSQVPPSPEPKPVTLIYFCPRNSLSVPIFSQAFSATNTFYNSSELNPSVDELVGVFNSYCTVLSCTILDSIVWVRSKKLKCSSVLWLNEEVRILKRQCRKAERKWKKDKLSASRVDLKSFNARLSV